MNASIVFNGPVDTSVVSVNLPADIMWFSDNTICQVKFHLPAGTAGAARITIGGTDVVAYSDSREFY